MGKKNATESDIRTLKQAYGGYAPGEQFEIRRVHDHSGRLLATPIDQPFRGITIPASYLETK